MLKKVIAAAISAALTLTAAAYVGSAETEVSPIFSEELDMYGIISESGNIVLASYESKTGSEYKFKVIRSLKNEMPESVFYLTAGEHLGDKLTKNGRYVLFLGCDASVYYPHDKYTAINDILLTAGEKNRFTDMTAGGIPVKNYPKTVSALKRYIDEVPDSSPQNIGYIRSDSSSEIIKGSDLIVSARITERISDSVNGCGKYRCSTVHSYKGKIPDEFTVILFDSKVKTGGEYYLMMFENDREYVLSSKKSIISVSNSGFGELLKNGSSK